MIDLEEYLSGGFCWTFQGKQVSRHFPAEPVKETKIIQYGPMVELKCQLPSEIAQALCLIADERGMKVNEFLTKAIEAQVRRCWLND